MQPSPEQVAALRLRPMQVDDLATVAAIEACSHVAPWTESYFADVLAAQYGCVVLANQQTLAGYAVVMQAVDDLHLLTLAVRPDFRGFKLSHQLMDWAEQMAQVHGCTGILLEVRPSNQLARAAYAARGFVQIGVRRNYYPDLNGREDALVLRKLLNSVPHVAA